LLVGAMLLLLPAAPAGGALITMWSDCGHPGSTFCKQQNAQCEENLRAPARCKIIRPAALFPHAGRRTGTTKSESTVVSSLSTRPA
jgi:hypothetical protein